MNEHEVMSVANLFVDKPLNHNFGFLCGTFIGAKYA